MNINFEKASFKDFENIPGMDPFGWAALFNDYLGSLDKRGHLNYRLENLTGCGPEMDLDLPGNTNRSFVSLVSNDYLGFTQHPAVKAAAIASIERYGSGAGASPAIGGHYLFTGNWKIRSPVFLNGKAQSFTPQVIRLTAHPCNVC